MLWESRFSYFGPGFVRNRILCQSLGPISYGCVTYASCPSARPFFGLVFCSLVSGWQAREAGATAPLLAQLNLPGAPRVAGYALPWAAQKNAKQKSCFKNRIRKNKKRTAPPCVFTLVEKNKPMPRVWKSLTHILIESQSKRACKRQKRFFAARVSFLILTISCLRTTPYWFPELQIFV